MSTVEHRIRVAGLVFEIEAWFVLSCGIVRDYTGSPSQYNLVQ